MTLIGKLHPLLIHFPIAFVFGAAVAELAVIVTGQHRWRPVALANLLAAATFGVAAAVAGWRLATDSGLDSATLLEWHRYLGCAGAAMTLVAGIAGVRMRGSGPLVYRVALFAAAALVASAGHLGGVMVWGRDFLTR
jgi:uncharacterized membrane protein